jgi:hypothetical protein
VELLKLFYREAADEGETAIDPSQHRGDGLEQDLLMLILDQLARGGVAEDCIAVEVRALGTGADGRQVYVGMVRLARWQPRTALRMLLGLPILQAKVRRAFRTSWMHDVSHFAGLWLHPSGQFEQGEPMVELRHMIVKLEQIESAWASSGSDPSNQSVWSVPLDLMEPPSRD